MRTVLLVRMSFAADQQVEFLTALFARVFIDGHVTLFPR